MGPPDPTMLEKIRRHLDLSPSDLYLRYVGVTGAASQADVDAYLLGFGAELGPHEHDKLVVVLNECCLERGLPEPLSFSSP